MKTIFFTLVFAFVSLPLFADEPAATPGAAVEATKPVEKAAADETEFTGEQLQIKKKLDALFDASRKVGTAGAEGEKAKKEIENAMDWDKVAQVCIGPTYYKKQSAGNLAE